MDQFLRRARRDVRAMGVVTFGVSLSAITASDGKNKDDKKSRKQNNSALDLQMAANLGPGTVLSSV